MKKREKKKTGGKKGRNRFQSPAEEDFPLITRKGHHTAPPERLDQGYHAVSFFHSRHDRRGKKALNKTTGKKPKRYKKQGENKQKLCQAKAVSRGGSITTLQKRIERERLSSRTTIYFVDILVVILRELQYRREGGGR